jgi:hypothetical protein
MTLKISFQELLPKYPDLLAGEQLAGFASIERDEHTMQTMTGQAANGIYPKIGSTKLKNFRATDADKFFQQIAQTSIIKSPLELSN